MGHNRHSYVCQLLPFFEQNALYEQVVSIIKQQPAEIPAGMWDPYNGGTYTLNGVVYRTPWARTINVLICPSSAGTGWNGIGRISYRCNSGDLFVKWDTYHALRGPFGPGDRLVCNFGMISDGTSNTAMFSEAEIGSTAAGTNIKGHMACNVPYGSPQQMKQTVLTGAEASGQFGQAYVATEPGTGDRVVGCRWGDAIPSFTQFFMILPPNGISFSAASGNIEGPRLCMTASSNHSGGVNLAMCDGSVKFVTDSVNAGDQNVDPWDGDINYGGDGGNPPGTAGGDANLRRQAAARASGPSPYGVWGAMGSRKGKDSAAL
jgi:prepilin-type processing-associated H-X9-DG protein